MVGQGRFELPTTRPPAEYQSGSAYLGNGQKYQLDYCPTISYFGLMNHIYQVKKIFVLGCVIKNIK